MLQRGCETRRAALFAASVLADESFRHVMRTRALCGLSPKTNDWKLAFAKAPETTLHWQMAKVEESANCARPQKRIARAFFFRGISLN